MRTMTVRDLLVPLSEYATVNESASLFEAVQALEAAQKAFDPKKHKHRAILVLDAQKDVVGKLGMFDILMALEPKYADLDAAGMLSRSGYSPEMIQSLLKDHFLWSEPMKFLCSRTPNLRVRDFMEAPADGVYINEYATLDEAIHQIIMCRYQSLLVTRDDKVVGILRLSDVFSQICDQIRNCQFR